MAPPVVAAATTNPSDCLDSTPVSLKPFKDLIEFLGFEKIPKVNLVDPELQASLKVIDIYFRIDDKGFGNGNGLLEKKELDRFLEKNRELFPSEATVCQLLAEARELAREIPQIKMKLRQAPDLTPVDLAPLKAFPYLDELIKLPKEISSMEEFRNLLVKTSMPKDLQEALIKEEAIRTAYISARQFLEADVDPKDGKLSVEDIKKLFEQNPEEAKELESNDPSVILAQARTQVPALALQGKKIQTALDRSTAKLVLHLLEQTIQERFDQEKIDHAGPAGDSYMGKLMGWILFRESWNTHFQETRPLQHKEERAQAVESLKTRMEQHPELTKIEEVLSSCDEKTIKVLKKDLDIDRWIQVANAKTDLDRSRILARLANEYRVGKRPGFWDFNLIPCPRLGSGGWWDRAKHLENWSWGKSPDILLALAIDHYLATNNSSLSKVDQEGRSLILLTQLPVSDQKSFSETMGKAAKGEGMDLKAARDMVNRSPLTLEGKRDLLTHLDWAFQMSNNAKLLRELSSLSFLQSLSKEEQDALGNIFSSYIQGTLDAEKIENTFLSSLPREAAETLISYLHQMTVVRSPVEDKGVETLFRETQLGGQEPRLRKIFDKENPTEAEKTEFKGLLEESKLSPDNKSVMQFLFDHQEETRIAQAAEKEFRDILGSPQKKKNPLTGEDEWDPKSVGSLHASLRITADRAVGLGIFAGPTVLSTGAGYLFSSGISRFLKVKSLIPWWGAIAGAAVGALFTISPYGARYRETGEDIMKIPYRPWSDLAVADMPAEGLGYYAGLASGVKFAPVPIGIGRYVIGLKNLPPLLYRIENGLVYGGGIWTGLRTASGVDGLWRPPTPLIPSFNQDFLEKTPSPPLQKGTFL